MKKSLLSVSLIALMSLGLTSCNMYPILYSEEGTTWIVEGGERPTGHIGDEVDETTSESDEGEETTPSEHTEHTWDEGVVTKEATCTEEGEITYTCLECEETYTVTIGALGHSYENGFDEEYHYEKCSVCGDTINKEEHTFIYTDNEDRLTHTKECECGYSATESHTLPETYTDNGDGTHSRSCVCGYTETTAHTYSSLDDLNCTGCSHVEAALDISISLDGSEITVTGISESFSGGELVIPSVYHGYAVTNIAKNAFKNNTDITSVVIPNTVTRIEEGGFDGCSNMESVTFAETSTLNYIGYNGFRNCSSLTSFKMPDSVQSTDNQVLYGCSSLTEFYVRSDYGTLTSHFFEKCSSLEHVTLPTNTTSIKSSTFSQCTSLKEITLPSGVTSIGTTAFYSCSSLSEVNGLSDGKVETIGKQAFSGCSSLTKIELPTTLTDLDNDEIFNKCSNLETISIPDVCQITSIGKNFANNCEKLTGFTIPSTVTSIGDSAFNQCYSLEGELVIPDGVTTIGKNAFEYCTGITSIIMGNNVTSIGDTAFARCSALVSVVLSDGVSLSSASFDYQYNSFTTVYYYGDADSWAKLNVTESHNTPLYNATVYYYSDTYVNEYSWHLVNGSPSTSYS